MRQYIYGNKNRFPRILLLCCLIATFLTPAIHSHRHDNGEVHHDLSRKTGALYTPVVHHYAGEWPSENLLAREANGTDFSSHAPRDNRHAHSLDNLFLRAKKVDGSIETPKSCLIQAASKNFPLKEISRKNYCQTSLGTHPSNFEFIFIATDLPPPIA